MLDVSPSFSVFELSSRRTRYLHTKLRHVRLRSRAETREGDREIIAKGTASYLGEIVCFRPAPVAARNVQRTYNGRVHHVPRGGAETPLRNAKGVRPETSGEIESRGTLARSRDRSRLRADGLSRLLFISSPSKGDARKGEGRNARRRVSVSSAPRALTSLVIAAGNRESVAHQSCSERHRAGDTIPGCGIERADLKFRHARGARLPRPRWIFRGKGFLLINGNPALISGREPNLAICRARLRWDFGQSER